MRIKYLKAPIPHKPKNNMSKQHYLLTLSLCIFFSVQAQDPVITSWKLNTTGNLANYEHYENGPNNASTSVSMPDSSDVKSVCYDATDVYITSNGLASYTMGPFVGNPNVPGDNDYTFKFPRTPMEETGSKRSVPGGGAIAVSSNGVVFFGFGDARTYNDEGVWEQDAWVSEGSTMDAGAGHPTGGGIYHYHATPLNLYNQGGTEHSAIVGYAFDGFPIYGPYGYSSPTDANSGITRMVSGYELRNITTRTTLPGGAAASFAGPDVSVTYPIGTYIQDYEFVGNGHLDQYNGRFCYTPEYPTGTYAYFITTDINGNPAFPYVLAEEYYGSVSQFNANKGGTITAPSGLSCYDGVPTNISKATAAKTKVYPNPATDIIGVSSPEVPDEISLFSNDGVLHIQMQPNSSQTEIDCSGLSAGHYVVKIKNGETYSFESLVLIK